jgi:hypothetical protein
MRRFLGLQLLLWGAVLACWTVYAWHSGTIKNQGSLAGVGACLALLLVGARWVRAAGGSRRPESGPGAAPPRNNPPPAFRGLNVNLSDLTLAGWGLFLCTCGVFGGGLTWFVLYVPHDRGGQTSFGLANLGLAIGFFLLGKFLLARLGYPIYRQG